MPVLTAAEEVEYDATEFKFSKLILHIRPIRLIHLFNTVYALRCTFGNAPFAFYADSLFSLDSKSGFAAGVLATIC